MAAPRCGARLAALPWPWLWLWLWLALAGADELFVLVTPAEPRAGDNVTLTPTELGPLRQVDWYRGEGAPDGGSRILSFFPGQSRPQRDGARSTGRERGRADGTLVLLRARPGDSGLYRVALQLLPQGSRRGQVRLLVRDAEGTEPPPAWAPPAAPQYLGWVVAAVLVGALLAGALGTAVLYRRLRRAEPATRAMGKLDPQVSGRSDKQHIYEVMESPLDSPLPGGNTNPCGPPDPPVELPPELRYMELLSCAESVYEQIQR
ncbi:carcinoembryonic antigen-related cell adhesion molecule 19 [Alligator mississippiensis]|uniref:Carcinoembryonic antigen-related cell adhesion molecule 19 n=1 Tax=Alligator mississippiensis TaxID=8496 RepID=A0A151NKS0_ALLMI|nr:carcinoembryonic antigen-related cell adhesion molecule 19 [Alligator mississippiensis]KYO37085.1 carcinoembryonic antigen-related cell adhesion molecule 19 [Alligator mississippiensis]